MGYESKTIKFCIDNIKKDKFVMPAIQREFVWKPEQIEELFDSLMQGYPISSFLFWNVDGENVKDYKFYKFIKEYHELKQKHNERYKNESSNQLTAVLDGQQRLTSLYIGLVGSYTEKLPYKRLHNPDAYIKKELYLNLLSGVKDEFSSTVKYEFKFLTSSEIENKEAIWFKVSHILSLEDIGSAMLFAGKLSRELTYLSEEQHEQVHKNLSALWNVVYTTQAINYHLEETNYLDKVLQIFIRVNSGGTKLSYSDLLMSIAISDWQGKDAREEIYKLVDDINEKGFNVSKDFVLKTCLVLCDFEDIGFNIKNFNNTNMQKIEKNWENIKATLLNTFSIIQDFGLNNDTVPSYNALIPIVYYLFKKGNPNKIISEDRQLIFKWLVRTALKQTFSGHPDGILKPIRDWIKDLFEDGKSPLSFPLDLITANLKKQFPNKSISFEKNDDYEFLKDLKYGKPSTYLLLALLSPGNIPSKIYHQDHIFPQFLFKNELKELNLEVGQPEFYEEKKNTLANIQLLEGNINQSKSSKEFKVWLEETYPNEHQRKGFLVQQNIPSNHSLEFKDFPSFIAERERLLIEKLKPLI